MSGCRGKNVLIFLAVLTIFGGIAMTFYSNVSRNSNARIRIFRIIGPIFIGFGFLTAVAVCIYQSRLDNQVANNCGHMQNPHSNGEQNYAPSRLPPPQHENWMTTNSNFIQPPAFNPTFQTQGIHTEASKVVFILFLSYHVNLASFWWTNVFILRNFIVHFSHTFLILNNRSRKFLKFSHTKQWFS